MSQHQLKHISMPDRINEVITYYEFFKSALTNCELLTGIKNQMDLHSVDLNLINGYHNTYLSSLNDINIYIGPVTLACVKLYQILTELEDKCKNDITNKQQ